MGPYIALVIFMAAIFGLCYLVDRCFKKLFRSQAQHDTGKAVKLNKKYGSIGLIMAVLGVAGCFAGFGQNWLLFAGGCMLIVVGIGLVVYYMSFGVYYDKESFVLSTFGKKTTTYTFAQIQAQQLYTGAAGIVIELYMNDGRAVQLQPGMKGVDEFLDCAFAGWLTQSGKTLEECDFHDPSNSCWFPPVS